MKKLALLILCCLLTLSLSGCGSAPAASSHSSSSTSQASTSIHVEVGFVKEDWLFMESIKIKVGEDDYISKYFDYLDVDRDTLGGSTIQEEMDCSISLEDVEKLLAATDPVMRFEGQDGATYDHQMTSEELSSLQTIYDLSNCLDGIWDILNQWMDDNMR